MKRIIIIIFLLCCIPLSAKPLFRCDDASGTILFTPINAIQDLNVTLKNQARDIVMPTVNSLATGVSFFFTSIYHLCGTHGSLFVPAGNSGAYPGENRGLQPRSTIINTAVILGMLGFSSIVDREKNLSHVFAIVPVNPAVPAQTSHMEITGPNPLARERYGLYLYYSIEF